MNDTGKSTIRHNNEKQKKLIFIYYKKGTPRITTPHNRRALSPPLTVKREDDLIINSKTGRWYHLVNPLGKRTEELGTVIRRADFIKRTLDSIIHFPQISRRTSTVINMAFHVLPQIFNYVAVG